MTEKPGEDDAPDQRGGEGGIGGQMQRLDPVGRDVEQQVIGAVRDHGGAERHGASTEARVWRYSSGSGSLMTAGSAPSSCLLVQLSRRSHLS
jgi:hypothetical protein